MNLMLSLLSKYAERIIRKCREQDTKTPFLRHILYGEHDAFLGRPLTNSEIAEECMGGMYVYVRTALEVLTDC